MTDKDRPPRESPALYEALGRVIKVERTARGVGRRELAERSGVSYPYLSEIENGTKRVGPKPLLLIARALGMSQSDLMRLAEEMSGEGAAAPEAPPFPGPQAGWLATRRANLARFATTAAGPAESDPERARAIGEIVELVSRLTTADVMRVRDLARRLSEP